jgi:hypothetical protein
MLNLYINLGLEQSIFLATNRGENTIYLRLYNKVQRLVVFVHQNMES